MAAALLIDFGSTYTKLRALDLDGLRVLASGQGPSTVTTDVTLGLDVALADLNASLGRCRRSSTASPRRRRRAVCAWSPSASCAS